MNLQDKYEKETKKHCLEKLYADYIDEYEWVYTDDYNDWLEERINRLEEALNICLVGSCKCMTKTPEVEYHKEWCPYRKIQEVLND